MKTEVRATYVTSWDDGETILESPCKVDLLTHEIISIGKRKVIQSPYKNSQIDDNIESLDREYIKFSDGTCCDIVDYNDEWSFKDKLGMAPFYKSSNC